MLLRRPSLVLAAAAILLLLPSLVLGTLVSHSSPQNLTWAAQFSEQVRSGVLYPRLRMGSGILWRDLHSVTGIWITAFALFLLATGLPWATRGTTRPRPC